MQYAARVEVEETDADDVRTDLSSKILRTLKKALRVDKQDLLDTISDDDKRYVVQTKIQNWLGTGSKLEKVISKTQSDPNGEGNQ